MMPVDAPCAGGPLTAPNKTVPISMKIDAETNAIFFKNYTRILGLLKKAVGLRLATVAFSTNTNLSPSLPAALHQLLRIAQARFSLEPIQQPLGE